MRFYLSIVVLSVTKRGQSMSGQTLGEDLMDSVSHLANGISHSTLIMPGKMCEFIH